MNRGLYLGTSSDEFCDEEFCAFNNLKSRRHPRSSSVSKFGPNGNNKATVVYLNRQNGFDQSKTFSIGSTTAVWSLTNT